MAALTTTGGIHVRASLTYPPLTAALSASLTRHGIPAAAVMVANSNAAPYHFEFGHCDSVSGLPVSSRSIFEIASMTKPITAVAAMQLMERGKLRLDDPVAKYLPELENLEILSGFSEDGHPIPSSCSWSRFTASSPDSYVRFRLYWDAEQLRYTQYLEKTKTPRPLSLLSASIPLRNDATGPRMARCS
jgi:CubicO group peptidase (beta-lactamase class C family)